MTGDCVVCGTPTTDHLIFTAVHGQEKEFCCTECWSRREDADVQDALVDEGVLTWKKLLVVFARYRSATTPEDFDQELLNALDQRNDVNIKTRKGDRESVLSFAGAEVSDGTLEAEGPLMALSAVIDASGDADDTVYTAFGYVPAGGAQTEVFTAWLCIGDSPDTLSEAVEQFVEQFAAEH